MTNILQNLNRDNGPLYLSLRRRLGQYMLEHELKTGERFPSHQEIAKLAGVSRVTARLAIKQLERDGLLVNHGVRGTFVRQLPTAEQVVEPSPYHRQIGVVLSQWDHADALSWNDARMMPGILDAAAANGIAIQMIPHELTTQNPLHFDRYIQERRVDGLIWLIMRYPEAVVATRWLERGLPQVAALSRVEGVPIPMVCEDNAGAASRAVQTLVAEGHQRVLIIHAGQDDSCNTQRLESVRDELQRQGVEWPEDWFLKVPEWPFPVWLPRHLEEALRRVQPTAVLMLAAITSELVEAGRAVGLEFGGNCRLISFHPPVVIEGAKPSRYTYFWPQLREIGQGVVTLWQRALAEFERDKQARPEWVESVPMEMNEFSPLAMTASKTSALPSWHNQRADPDTHECTCSPDVRDNSHNGESTL